jgi:hypothetical protein
MYKLGQVFDVYGKKLPEGACRVWEKFFLNYEYDDCVRALDDHIKTEQYAPKPYTIEVSVKSFKTSRGESEYVYRGNCPLTIRALEEGKRSEEKYKNQKREASDEVNTAWIIYHRIVHGGNFILPPNQREQKIQMTRERALEIVNEQAAKHNMPEAIEPKYRIASYWE